jgi:uncharacterized protein (TIGR02284 family)
MIAAAVNPPSASPLRRASFWLQRLLGRESGGALGAVSWDPIPARGIRPERDDFERARLAERIMLLATLSRASYGSFAGAAQHEPDPSVAEWLRQCARQRKALASELRGIVLVLAEGDVSPPWQRWVAQVAVENPGSWGESWIGRCMRGEENLLRLYEQLFHSNLPSGMATLLQRQYAQIVQTLDQLRRRPVRG